MTWSLVQKRCHRDKKSYLSRTDAEHFCNTFFLTSTFFLRTASADVFTLLEVLAVDTTVT